MERRKLTPEEIADQHRGATRLGPGAWMDRDGGLHFSVPEILAHYGVRDTPAERARVQDMIAEMIRELYPETTVVIQD